MNFKFHLFFGLCLIGLLVACRNEPKPDTAKEDVLLVTVHNKHLYKSELDGMVPMEATPQDSAMIANAFIEKWIRESLLMHEAEKNIPNDLNIDDLVRDYRASLIRHNYEQILVELLLDSIVTTPQITAYYEENKEQFRLDAPIIQCVFVEIPLNSPDFANAEKWWTDYLNGKPEAFKQYTETQASNYLMVDSTWYRESQIQALLPKQQQQQSLTKNREIKTRDDQFQYYLKVFDRLAGNNIAPMGFVKDQIVRVILHQRKIKLLDDKREEIYEREINRNTIKVY